jgi:hypothetical protein
MAPVLMDALSVRTSRGVKDVQVVPTAAARVVIVVRPASRGTAGSAHPAKQLRCPVSVRQERSRRRGPLNAGRP